MSRLSEDFPFSSMSKQTIIQFIDISKLDENRQLYLEGVLPGDVIVINEQSKIINVPQYQVYQNDVCNGVKLDFKKYDNLTNWKIRKLNSSLIDIENSNLQNLMILSLIFN